MSRIERFEDLKSWQQAREVCRAIYAATRESAFAHDRGLRDQIRRSSESLMSNIAEGFGAGSDTEFIRFLRYAHRSGNEVKSQLYVALDNAYLDQTSFDQLYENISAAQSLIAGLIRYLLKD
jgi:four helix bundle protein